MIFPISSGAIVNIGYYVEDTDHNVQIDIFVMKLRGMYMNIKSYDLA
jgi:hypothetical protein